MPISQNFPFTDSINYNQTNTQISAGKAKLAVVPNPGQVFAEDFADDTGFTYDNTKAEFTGGLVRQKDLRPANSVVAATFTASKNLSWSQGGSLVATDVGTPVLNAGKLECLGGGNNAVLFQNTEIGNVGNVGAMKLKYTPNYSGTPATNVNIFSLTPPSGNNGRLILLHSASGGTLRLTSYTSAGTAKYTAQIMGAAWSPVAGQTYEIELNWDTQIGAVVRVFIDGVLWGASPVSSYDRGTGASQLRVGAGVTYPNADASFDDVVLFSAVQHTSGYVAGYTLPENTYAASVVVLPAFSYTGLGSIQEVEESAIVEVGAPRYTVGGLYWNGVAWVVSNGTYAQANTSADVIANLPSLNVTGASTVTVRIYFNDSNSLSSVADISVTVTGQKYAATGYLEPAQAIQVKKLFEYVETATIPGGTSVKVIIKVDGALKWFNGAAWVASNGTTDQANEAADLTEENLALLVLGVNSSVCLRWVLTTDSNTVTPELDDATISYDFGALETDLAKCIIFGYIRDIIGDPIANVKCTFSLVAAKKTYQEANNNVILSPPITVTTDSNGYFSIPLVRTSEYESGGQYQVVLEKADTVASKGVSGKLTFEVPDAETKDITDLLAA